MLPTPLRRPLRQLKAVVQGWRSPSAPRFDCPVCGWHGVFLAFRGRLHAKCPKCDALERHRLQRLVLDQLLPTLPTASMRALHVAPEEFFRASFKQAFGAGYETADIQRPDVDHNVDLQKLPFADASYDFVYASHVLEHILDDHAALREIRRILRPGGVAVLPVPVFDADATIEYGKPDPNESYHVRQPGRHYYERYRGVFARVDVRDSAQFPAQHQVFTLTRGADGSVVSGCDYVPVCHA
jgi:SAM-dependent methyltransferase